MTRIAISQPDLTLQLDGAGLVRAASASSAIASDGLGSWVGLPWAETVEPPARDQLRRILAALGEGVVSTYVQVTQLLPSGRSLPVEYALLRQGGESGLTALGRSLQPAREMQRRLMTAQRAREREYWKHREEEMRSRLLFDSSLEAVLVVSALSLDVVEANPTAIRELGIARGWNLMEEIAPGDRAALNGLLARARAHGRTPAAKLRFGAEEEPWLLRASLLAHEPEAVLLLQLGRAARTPAQAEELVDALPDAFVVADEQGRLLHANGAFLGLTGCTGETVLGEPLGRWLATPGRDAAALLRLLHEQGEARLFPATLTPLRGEAMAVEISGRMGGTRVRPAIGLLIRDVGRRPIRADGIGALCAALGEVLREMGQLPLPVLVRNTGALVERAWVERALRDAGGNRTAAAETLGLSRQSLYAKLERYGLQELRHATVDAAERSSSQTPPNPARVSQ